MQASSLYLAEVCLADFFAAQKVCASVFEHNLACFDYVASVRDLESELILNDLAIVESRLDKLTRELRVGRKEGEREHALLVRLKAGLEAERPLRGETFDNEESKLETPRGNGLYF